MKRIALTALGLAILVAASVTADARSGGGISKNTPRIDARPPLSGSVSNNTGAQPRINRDLGLRVQCTRVPHRDKLGVFFVTRECRLY